MKKKASLIKAFLILFGAIAIIIIHTTCPDKVFHIHNLTLIYGRTPKYPPQGITVCLRPSTIRQNLNSWSRYTTNSDDLYHTDVNRLRQSHDTSIPYLSELLHTSNDSAQVQELAHCEWDTLYIVKPHCPLDSLDITNATHELAEAIGQDGPKDGTCVLVFSSKGKIMQYAFIQNDTFDFNSAPDMLTHGYRYTIKSYGVGPVQINHTKIKHAYEI